MNILKQKGWFSLGEEGWGRGGGEVGVPFDPLNLFIFRQSLQSEGQNNLVLIAKTHLLFLMHPSTETPMQKLYNRSHRSDIYF